MHSNPEFFDLSRASCGTESECSWCFQPSFDRSTSKSTEALTSEEVEMHTEF